MDINGIALLGIDCATQPEKVGLALAEQNGAGVRILRCAKASKSAQPATIAAEWLAGCDGVLIALDAPLGWPRSLGQCLSTHKAGLPTGVDSNHMFSRNTDMDIFRRLGKRPLEVGADRIARTAVSALKMLQDIREKTGRDIPLAWAPAEGFSWRAIEVYPAATRIAHGAPDNGGSLAGLESLIDRTVLTETQTLSNDMVDAMVCTLAAADFLRGNSIAPNELDVARTEGWIWALAKKP
jgi:predicted nuclease with RNAse H fold